MKPTLLSLFDYTGNWSAPYKRNGWNVVQVDKLLGQGILTFDYKKLKNVRGILAAVPCTDFALCGSSRFRNKDRFGITDVSIQVARKTIEIINYFSDTLYFWCVENPMSRIHKLLPGLGAPLFKFNPNQFAGYNYHNPKEDCYKKQTWLWGKFRIPELKSLPAIMGAFDFLDRPSKGKGTTSRSDTPIGFANAFYLANH